MAADGLGFCIPLPTILNKGATGSTGESPVFIRSRWDHDEYYDPENSKGIADASDAFALDSIGQFLGNSNSNRPAALLFVSVQLHMVYGFNLL